MRTLVNFRDVGGIKTTEGKKVTLGKIFRSGEIFNLSDEDKNLFVDQYGIKTIFDLRGDKELVERPDDTFQGTEYVHIDIMKDTQGQSSSLEDLSKEPVSADDHMKTIYREILKSKSGKGGYQHFLEKISSEDKPFIFHCFAGKDRTGIAAALILGILEVPREDIYKDYLLTNVMRKSANDTMIDDLRQRGMSDTQLKEIETMMYVKKDYLDVTFEALDKEYGGILGFVKNELGLSKSAISDMKRIYTR